MQPPFSEEKLRAFLVQVLGDVAACGAGFLTHLGHKLGLCCQHALSEPGGQALGAQAGEARLGEVFRQAGFRSFRRATETPFNLVLEARK